MQPTLCSKCKKNVAVVFISRMNEKGEPVNEGLCLQCAAKLGLPQVEDMMKRMGITPEDLESLSGEMMQAFGGAEELEDLPEEEGGDEDESGKTATFPFLNRLFGGSQTPAEKQPGDQSAQGRETKGGKTEKKRKFLDNYCINLSRRAREGKLDAVIGREEEIERVVQILNRRQKNNPCLIGEPGVGKTAIAEGLAQRIVAGQVPFKLRDKEVYLLDLTALVAGTQFRGQFESRMKGLIEEIRKAGNIILVIDEVHNIVGAGDAEGSMNAANILKPALSRGEIQVIGATTFNEYRKFIEKDSALERRFQPVTVAEPNMEDTLKILKGIAHYYENFHGVQIPEGILRQAVTLSERYITDRFLPDKAIDLIDEACSDLNLRDASINRRMELKRDLENITFEREKLMSAEPEEGKEFTQEELDTRYARIAELRSQEMRLQAELTEIEKKGVPQLTMENIARVIELWTKIPASKIREEEFKRLSELEDRLKQEARQARKTYDDLVREIGFEQERARLPEGTDRSGLRDEEYLQAIEKFRDEAGIRLEEGEKKQELLRGELDALAARILATEEQEKRKKALEETRKQWTDFQAAAEQRKQELEAARSLEPEAKEKEAKK